MVKIPPAEKGRRLMFFGAGGRMVPESRRYQDATLVKRKFRGKWHTIYEQDEPITPKVLADLVPRDEFEALAPNYADPVRLETRAKKYTAWSLANHLDNNKVRGLRGHTAKVDMLLRDGKRLRKVSFYHRFRRKGSFAYGVFLAMNKAIGNEGMHLYNRLGSKLLPDRKGRKVRLIGLDVAIEL